MQHPIAARAEKDDSQKAPRLREFQWHWLHEE
jgi:hypothetical protein